MAQDYLDDIVQKIVTRCDISGFVELAAATEELTKKARALSRAYSRAITPEQRIQLEQIALAKRKSAEITSWNTVLLERERNAMSANRLEAIRSQTEKAKYNAQDRLATQQSRERTAQLNKETAAIRKQTTATRQQSGAMRFLGRMIFTYFGIHTIKGVVDTASRLELLQKSIIGLTKSTQDWDYVKKQAFDVGIDFETVAKGYRNFYPSAKMAGFDKSNIQQMYSDVLLSTRAIGASPQQTEGALLALEQMISKGTVSMEELRRQLGNALPGAFEIGAKAMNMTTQQFNEFVRKGQLASNVFVPKFIEQLKKEYADGFKDIAQTVSYASVRLSNSWKEFQYEILNGEAGKELAKGLEALTRFLRSPEAKNLAQNIGRLTTVTIRLLTFLLEHGKLILFLFGLNGVLGLFGKYPQILSLLSLGLKDAAHYALLCGKANVTAFLAANGAALKFLGTITAIFGLLFVLEDVIVGFGQHFLGWNAQSNFGYFLDEFLGKKGERKAELAGRDTDLQGLPPIIRNNKDLMKQYRRYQRNNDWEGLANFVEKYARPNVSTPIDRPKNMSTFADRPAELSLDKSQQITMGDIKIEVQGSSNPQETALAVKDVLVALFTGQTGVTTA